MTVDTDQDEFLTVADIANRLKLNQQTIYNWIDRGQLPAVRVGARRVRVRRSDLDALLAAGETQARSGSTMAKDRVATGPEPTGEWPDELLAEADRTLVDPEA